MHVRFDGVMVSLKTTTPPDIVEAINFSRKIWLWDNTEFLHDASPAGPDGPRRDSHGPRSQTEKQSELPLFRYHLVTAGYAGAYVHYWAPVFAVPSEYVRAYSWFEASAHWHAEGVDGPFPCGFRGHDRLRLPFLGRFRRHRRVVEDKHPGSCSSWASRALTLNGYVYHICSFVRLGWSQPHRLINVLFQRTSSRSARRSSSTCMPHRVDKCTYTSARTRRRVSTRRFL